MDSDTYRRPAADQRRSAFAGRHRLPDGRQALHLHLAMEKSAETAGQFGVRPATIGEATGRMRAAMLIIIAIVALSAIAAIGWLQYQSNEARDPQYEISEPDRSLPALANSSAR